MGNPMAMYHAGNRELQDKFGSRALADRLAAKTWRDRFKDTDKAFIESVGFFFLATANRDGEPDCSFKGGAPGFVQVPAPDLLVFPDYDGNGMFKSLGNIRVNPSVGLLFIAMNEKPQRLRVNGRAVIVADDPLMTRWAGSQLLIRVTPTDIFPNCPRYIPDLPAGAPSQYIPCAGAPPIEPAWKGFDDFKDVVPPRRA
jgi:predicted pyridoxine 5'-phosphate oxidase superfamily flavin-nucleotide-binding protein